jgi:hypothetical protein
VKDTFSRLDIARDALGVVMECVTQLHGFRGGSIPIGEGWRCWVRRRWERGGRVRWGFTRSFCYDMEKGPMCITSGIEFVDMDNLLVPSRFPAHLVPALQFHSLLYIKFEWGAHRYICNCRRPFVKSLEAAKHLPSTLTTTGRLARRIPS